MAKRKKEILRFETILPALCLVIGLLVGAALVPVFAGENSGIALVGEKKVNVPLGESFRYVDEGVQFFYFGIDLSQNVTVTTNMTKNADGSYTVDTSEEGVYYIAYTSTHALFERDVRLVRTFVVGGNANG